MDISQKVKERQLNIYNVFMASFIAGLNEIGMLNQANVLIASKNAGKALANFVKLRKDFPKLEGSGLKQAETLIKYLMEIMPLSVSWELKVLSTDELEIKIYKSSCKFCPKGVGGAQLEGTLCPYPGMFLSFIQSLIGEQFNIQLIYDKRSPMFQDSDGCRVRLKIQPKS